MKLENSKTYKSYVKAFGEEQAQALYEAAKSHMDRHNMDQGNDPFAWAVFMAMSYHCVKVNSFAEHHGITVGNPAFEYWVYLNRDLLAQYEGGGDPAAQFTIEKLEILDD